MNITKEVKSLNLPKDSYIVVGSGILAVLGIRESNDIDLVVLPEVFAEISDQGWEPDERVDQEVYKKGFFDLGTTWDGRGVQELLSVATIIDDVPFLNLADTAAWKATRGREKDLIDLELIKAYQASRKQNTVE